MSLPFDVQQQAKERNERYLARLARFRETLTPPEEIQRLREERETLLNFRRTPQANRTEYVAGLRNNTSQNIEASFRERQSAHISGNMATHTHTRTHTRTHSTQRPAPTIPPFFQRPAAAAPEPHTRPTRQPSRAPSPPVDIGDSASQAGRDRPRRNTNPFRNEDGTPRNPSNHGDGGGDDGGGDDGDGGDGGDDGDGEDDNDGDSNRTPNYDASSPEQFFRSMTDAIGRGVGIALSNQPRAPPAAPRDKVRARVRDPDIFDGKDPEKLRTFLFQGILNFKDRPSAFVRDEQKVNYMISYLSGDALGWFEPSMVDPDPNNVPLWMYDYDAFVSELQLNFGTFDPRQDAENEIVALRMGDGQHIQKYLVRFNKLSQLTGWNSVALRKVFYDGLPERIQIKLRDLPGGKPTSLDVLKMSAQSIDASHWEWQKEQKLRHGRNSGPTPQKSGNSDKPNTSENKSGGNSSTPQGDSRKKKKKGSGGNGGNSGGSPAQTSSSTSAEKPYAKMLGPDGKLLPAEKARRLAENLCLLCGEKGHRSNDCPKKRGAAGRAASTSTTTTTPATTTPPAAPQSGN